MLLKDPSKTITLGFLLISLQARGSRPPGFTFLECGHHTCFMGASFVLHINFVLISIIDDYGTLLEKLDIKRLIKFFYNLICGKLTFHR
jgi:hypothetical protein